MPTPFGPFHFPSQHRLILSLLRCVEVCEATIEQRMQTDEFAEHQATRLLPNPEQDGKSEFTESEITQIAERAVFKLSRVYSGATGECISRWMEAEFPGITRHNPKPFPSPFVTVDLIDLAMMGLNGSGALIRRLGDQPQWVYVLLPSGRLYLDAHRNELSPAELGRSRMKDELTVSVGTEFLRSESECGAKLSAALTPHDAGSNLPSQKDVAPTSNKTPRTISEYERRRKRWNKLSDRERDFITSLRKLGATERQYRRTMSEVVRDGWGGQANPDDFKSVSAALRKKGLTNSQKGANGGIWLTPKGCELAELATVATTLGSN